MNFLAAIIVTLPVLSAFLVTTSHVRITPKTRFHSTIIAFNRDCSKIINASKSNDIKTVKRILKKYKEDEDDWEVLSMHSLINASRTDNLLMVKNLVEEHGVDPDKFNSIAKKQAAQYNSPRVKSYFEAHSKSTLNE